MLAALLLALVASDASQAGSVDARTITVSAPRPVADVSRPALKGSPMRLAWSGEGSVFYLLSREQEADGASRDWHYLLDSSSGALREIDDVPGWALEYWGWKSAQNAPGRPDVKIEVEIERKQMSAMGLGLDGGLARGATVDTPGNAALSDEATMAAIANRQMAIVCTLRLKGHLIGQWINSPVVPGLTFAWAPAPLALLAYADPDGHLQLMDLSGRQKVVKGGRNALLPGFSPKGDALAWLDPSAHDKFTLKIATVQRR